MSPDRAGAGKEDGAVSRKSAGMNAGVLNAGVAATGLAKIAGVTGWPKGIIGTATGPEEDSCRPCRLRFVNNRNPVTAAIARAIPP
jgi:hypothetical protein